MRSAVRWFIPLFAIAAVALATLNTPLRATTGGASARGVLSLTVTKLAYKLINLDGTAAEPKANGSVKFTIENFDLAEDSTLAFNLQGANPTGGEATGSLDIGDPSDPDFDTTSGVQLSDLSKSMNGKKFSSAKEAMIDINGTTYPIKASYSPSKMKLTVSIKKIGAQEAADIPFSLDLMTETKAKGEGKTVNLEVTDQNNSEGDTVMDCKISDKVNKKDDTITTSLKGVPAP